MFLISTIWNLTGCCNGTDLIEPQKTMKRYLQLSDTNATVERITYKGLMVALQPDSDLCEFPLSENVPTTAYIKIKGKSTLDSILIEPQFTFEYDKGSCSSDPVVYRTNPKFNIKNHSFTKVTWNLNPKVPRYSADVIEVLLIE